MSAPRGIKERRGTSAALELTSKKGMNKLMEQRSLATLDLEALEHARGGQDGLAQCVEAEKQKNPRKRLTNGQVVQACGQHMSEEMKKFYSEPSYSKSPWATYQLQ